MTNREFYKEQILDVVCTGNSFGLSKVDNAIHACRDIRCEDCKFSCDEGCVEATKKWCNEEYVEPSPFEKGELVEVSDTGASWTLRYFSHIESGRYYTFKYCNKSGDVVPWQYCQKYGTLGGVVHDNTKGD